MNNEMKKVGVTPKKFYQSDKQELCMETLNGFRLKYRGKISINRVKSKVIIGRKIDVYVNPAFEYFLLLEDYKK